MYLELGQETVITDKNILGIFDLDTATVSKETKKFISKREKKGLIEYTDYDLPRSFILISDKEKNESVKLSRISSIGLNQRIEGNYKIYNE